MSYIAYLGIKHYPDNRNRRVIESISTTLSDQGIETVCITRDIEKWGKVELTPDELMRVSLEQIDRSDFVLLEMTEKGVGLGIEAGYARASGKPLIVLTKDAEHLSTTIIRHLQLPPAFRPSRWDDGCPQPLQHPGHRDADVHQIKAS